MVKRTILARFTLFFTQSLSRTRVKYKNNEDDMHHLGIVSEDGSHKTATVYDAIQIKPKSVIRKSFLSFSNDQFKFMPRPTPNIIFSLPIKEHEMLTYNIGVCVRLQKSADTYIFL